MKKKRVILHNISENNNVFKRDYMGFQFMPWIHKTQQKGFYAVPFILKLVDFN